MANVAPYLGLNRRIHLDLLDGQGDQLVQNMSDLKERSNMFKLTLNYHYKTSVIELKKQQNDILSLPPRFLVFFNETEMIQS